MPLVRKLLIFAAVDGLILQPVSQRNQQRAVAPVKVDYKSHAISPLLRDVDDEAFRTSTPHLEVYGIIGLLTVSSFSYILAISQRTQVAQIWGKPVYVVTGIAIIPLASQAEARQGIEQAKKISNRPDRDEASQEGIEAQDGDSDTDIGTADNQSSADEGDLSSTGASVDGATGQEAKMRAPGIIEDVIKNKGGYGRFAERWFSRKGWSIDQTKNVINAGKERVTTARTAMRRPADGDVPEASSANNAHQQWPESAAVKEAHGVRANANQEHLTTSLLPKLIRTIRLLFSSRTFYFSNDYDISHRLGSQGQTASDVALHKQVDPQYFWNQHLIRPFSEGGYHEFVLPVMQGFVGQRSFSVDSSSASAHGTAEARSTSANEDPANMTQLATVADSTELGQKTEFLLTVISRRSVRRSGLRYLRRGIDEDGNVANAVETEQILSSPEWEPSQKISSFVQFRGSMPLFFSQTPYTFKPPPVLLGNPETNEAAAKKHFDDLSSRYGQVQNVSLVDRHGPETKIGEFYEGNVQRLNEHADAHGNKLQFEWFEFHHVCRGMKFENVSFLVDEMSSFLDSSSWSSTTGNVAQSTQTGIIRTNCMDCLDRTNVCQSAFGQYILERQLASIGYTIDLRNDPTTAWFNTLWADNGDAISRAYAGTAALKGDYTRTRKRNAIGALTDLTLTLSRYYHNLFEDFFAQAAIDYLLGTVTEAVFPEFEATMTTADPAMDLRKARESAIMTAGNVVIEDDSEDLVHGWALAMPALANSLRSFPFEESLLLLTDRALYAVRFDWSTDKVHSFERIELGRVKGLKWGAYIIETNVPAQMDVERNVGLVVRYSAAAIEGQESPTVRVNNRSLENAMETSPADPVSQVEEDGPGGRLEEAGRKAGAEEQAHILAFRALPSRSSVVRGGKADPVPVGERQSIARICEEIARVAGSGPTGGESGWKLDVEEGDIIGIEEAKKSTGYLEKIGYSLRKFVWG